MVSVLSGRTRAAGVTDAGQARAAASLGPSSQVQAEEAKVSWRPSRHARRLLTLAAAALLMALLTRNPALAGVAGPPLLLLGMARVGPGRSAGGGRPDVAGPTAHGERGAPAGR